MIQEVKRILCERGIESEEENNEIKNMVARAKKKHFDCVCAMRAHHIRWGLDARAQRAYAEEKYLISYNTP
jgi:hypothetical protein